MNGADHVTVRLGVNAVGAVMGGAARHLPPFLRALVVARPAWAIVVYVTEGAELDVPPGVDVVGVPAVGASARLRWENTWLPRDLRQRRVDALLNLTNSAPVRPPVPSLLYQRNPVYFDRSWVASRPLGFRAEAFARRQLAYVQMRRSALTLVPSAAMGEFLLNWRGAPRHVPVEVVHHAVDLERFPFVERDWPPPSDRPLRLLSVSHAAPHKDQALLVDVVRRLREAGVAATVDLTVDRADDPPTVDALLERARRLGVDADVHLLGRTSSPEQLYATYDVMVLPSLTESFGFPLVEAMASGIPVVCSDIPSSVEVLGGGGWYFRRGSATSAVEAIRSLLATRPEEFRVRMAEAKQLAGAFSWGANAEAIASAIETVHSSQRRHH